MSNCDLIIIWANHYKASKNRFYECDFLGGFKHLIIYYTIICYNIPPIINNQGTINISMISELEVFCFRHSKIVLITIIYHEFK